MKRLARCLKAAFLYVFADVRREHAVRDPGDTADPPGASGPD
jgi:hypothetical protein